MLSFTPPPVQRRLFHELPATDFGDTLLLGIEMIRNSSHLADLIVQDQDAMALEKKKVRQMDAEWEERRGLKKNQASLFPANDIESESQKMLRTKQRMRPEAVFVFFLVRAYLGNIKSEQSQNFIQDSKTLDYVLALLGYDKTPGASTIVDNLNCLSPETHDALLAATVTMAKKKDLDTMQEVYVDSTRVDANSTWPTESKTILALFSRIMDSFLNLRKGQLMVNIPKEVPLLLKQIESSSKAIALGMGSKGAEKKRKKEYRKILKNSKKTLQHLNKAMLRLCVKHVTEDIRPSVKLHQEGIIEQMKVDLYNVELCAKNAKKRVLQGGKVSPKEKVLGISDPDAEMISKGKTPVVFGYKPQVARSLNGFILALEVPQGAASDSSMATKMIEASINSSNVVPKLVSFDDGYASTDNLASLEGLGIDLVSFSGSKGKKITPVDDWNSKRNLKARNKRSMAESTMAVLKRDFGKDRFSRRGIDAVTEELKAVAVFHNLRLICRISKKNALKAA